jgi:glyoxylate reductase
VETPARGGGLAKAKKNRHKRASRRWYGAKLVRLVNRVFVTRRIPEPGLDVLRQADVEITVFQHDEEAGLSRTDVVSGVRGCDVLLSLLTEPVDRGVLEANPRLLGVANMAVGYDNIDVEAATALGIPVSNTPGVLTDTTADLTFAMILAVARRLPQAHTYTVAGRYRIWGPNLFLGGDVGPGASGQRKVLGIVGYGRIGAAVARRAAGFDMEVITHDPHARDRVEAAEGVAWVELDALLARSDFVTLHPPLTPETEHLIGAPQLQSMKPTAYLINAARGPVVDEAALVEALRGGVIAGAALDVYEREPALAAGLAALDNVVLLPHIASATHDTRGAMAMMAATNAVCHLRGERAPDVLNPEVYDTSAWAMRRADP